MDPTNFLIFLSHFLRIQINAYCNEYKDVMITSYVGAIVVKIQIQIIKSLDFALLIPTNIQNLV